MYIISYECKISTLYSLPISQRYFALSKKNGAYREQSDDLYISAKEGIIHSGIYDNMKTTLREYAVT
jgi:hypothetical protein